MLEAYLGVATFRRGIQAYLKKYAFGNARTDDLWAVLSQVSVRELDSSFFIYFIYLAKSTAIIRSKVVRKCIRILGGLAYCSLPNDLLHS